jgi:hypothetical protein
MAPGAGLAVRRPGKGRWALALLLSAALTGCELAEITTARAEDRVVVEGLLRLGLPRSAEAGSELDPAGEHIWATVFLHRTVQGEGGLNSPVPGARVALILPDGERVRLQPTALIDCVQTTPVQGTGSCYGARVLEADPARGGIDRIRPGDLVDLEVETSGGERMWSTTRVPGDFGFADPEHRSRCVLPPDTSMPLEWSPSPEAWAYVAETEIDGLAAALAPEGITVERGSLVLVGLSVGADDTTIVFPGEFGVFDRLDLDRDLTVRLQRGLPAGTEARVAVNAVDRNYVNWIRGGNFNPSGPVRIPSVQGDGTGFFGSSVTRWLDVVVSTEPGAGDDLPACPVATPGAASPAGS